VGDRTINSDNYKSRANRQTARLAILGIVLWVLAVLCLTAIARGQCPVGNCPTGNCSTVQPWQATVPVTAVVAPATPSTTKGIADAITKGLAMVALCDAEIAKNAALVEADKAVIAAASESLARHQATVDANTKSRTGWLAQVLKDIQAAYPNAKGGK
jgi:hypothetical protein